MAGFGIETKFPALLSVRVWLQMGARACANPTICSGNVWHAARQRRRATARTAGASVVNALQAQTDTTQQPANCPHKTTKKAKTHHFPEAQAAISCAALHGLPRQDLGGPAAPESQKSMDYASTHEQNKTGARADKAKRASWQVMGSTQPKQMR